jgi:hypothetical protein
MSKLADRLKDPSRSGVYRASRLDAVEDAVRSTRLHYARAELRGRADKAAVLDALAAALAFPSWFGGNWDALEDCLTDLSWREADGYVIGLAGIGAQGDDLGILVDILSSAAAFWGEQGKPFFAVFEDPQRAQRLMDLYREG